MNWCYLIDLFLKYEKDSFSKGCHVVSDFKKILTSSSSSMFVLEMLEKEIIPTINDVHDNVTMIDIKLKENNLEIVQGNKILFEKKWNVDKLYKSYNSCMIKYNNFFEESLKKILENKYTIFSFEEDEKTGKKLSDILYEIYLYVLNENYWKISILRIDEKYMFKLLDLKRYKGIFQYFYKRNNECFCAFIKCDPEGEKNFYDYPELYYFIKRIPEIEIKTESLQSKGEYYGGSEICRSVLQYESYVQKEGYKNVNYISYLEDNFTDIESNNFKLCYLFLKQQEEYKFVLKSFLDSLSEEQKSSFLDVLDFFCKCFIREGPFNCSCKLTDKIDYYESRILDKKMSSDGLLRESDKFYVDELFSFFKYLFNNHKNIIMKYKEEFMKILNSEIYFSLRFLSYNLREKIYYLITFYNFKKENINIQNYKDVYEILKKKLFLEEIEILAPLKKSHPEKKAEKGRKKINNLSDYFKLFLECCKSDFVCF